VAILPLYTLIVSDRPEFLKEVGVDGAFAVTLRCQYYCCTPCLESLADWTETGTFWTASFRTQAYFIMS